MSREKVKITLPESEIPKKWYNILADMPYQLDPFYSGATGKLVTPEELAAIFPPDVLAQEVSTERFIEIPEEVYESYKKFRPSPLMRAYTLEKLLDTPAKIYFKYEGGNATGSHKLNTALAQAYYNKKAGIKRIVTETGAGQWGSALSMACSQFGMECVVYMVKVSYNHKPFRRSFMHVFGAEVIPSPSDTTKCGREILKNDPDCTGSLGIAISEAVEKAVERDDTNYALGSVLNHVCLHQTVIGLEAKRQLEIAGDYPDVVIGCFGGGSNFAGISFPFLMDKFAGKNVRTVAVEPTACPTLTKGRFAYDYSDTGRVAPIAKMYTLGHDFIPAPDHAGGLRYHGASPIVSLLYNKGLIEAVALGQRDVFEVAITFARAEGIVPAPESSHAVCAAIKEALAAKEEGKERVILFNLSGHGYFDMYAYDDYLSGKMKNTGVDEATLENSFAKLPRVE